MSTKTSLFLLFGIGALFIAGLYGVIHRRFALGQDYPHGSSHRAAEDGSRAFYESLNALNGLSVTRINDPLAWGDSAEPRTIFAIGTRKYQLNEQAGEFHDILVNEVLSGSRLVIALTHRDRFYDESDSDEKDFDDKESAKKEVDGKVAKVDHSEEDQVEKEPHSQPSGDDADKSPIAADGSIDGQASDSEMADECDETDEAAVVKAKSPIEHMGIALDAMDNTDEFATARIVETATPLGLEKSLQWHAKHKLSPVAQEWNTLYKIGNNSVLAERPFGRGSIVILADDGLLMNEALKAPETRPTQLLSWLVGGNREVVFCETIHNIYREDSLSLLMRRYRLHGLILGMLLSFLLVIWKNAVPVVTPIDEPALEEITATSREQTTGFARLLKKHISVGKLPSLALNLWEKSFAHRPLYRQGHASQKLMEARSLVSTHTGNEATTPALFRKLHSLLNTKGH
ncbi:MAG: hypothetical protein SFY80_15580 [Verrucomicrobiota bacterium]|nr:hypothetical protein [Verrucomicrobiota bacterium]